jgi:hypothetical protein
MLQKISLKQNASLFFLSGGLTRGMKRKEEDADAPRDIFFLKALLALVIIGISGHIISQKEGRTQLGKTWDQDKWKMLSVAAFYITVSLSTEDERVHHALRAGLGSSFIALMSTLDYVFAPFWFVTASVFVFDDV